MKQNYATQQLQSLMTHHVNEIKRLRNSNEQYKDQNIALLQDEYNSFKASLNS